MKDSKIEANRVWIDQDTEIFYRAKTQFRVKDIVAIEEYVYDNFKDKTDSELTRCKTTHSDFLLEFSYEQLKGIWDNHKINPFN